MNASTFGARSLSVADAIELQRTQEPSLCYTIPFHESMHNGVDQNCEERVISISMMVIGSESAAAAIDH